MHHLVINCLLFLRSWPTVALQAALWLRYLSVFCIRICHKFASFFMFQIFQHQPPSHMLDLVINFLSVFKKLANYCSASWSLVKISFCVLYYNLCHEFASFFIFQIFSHHPPCHMVVLENLQPFKHSHSAIVFSENCFSQ